MVALPIVRSSNVKTLTSTPTYVAVFIGATAGIGSYGVKSLASSWYNANTSSSKQALPSGRHLRIYIVGRNLSAAEALIAECRQACPEGGDFRFIKADDLALLKDVRKCTGEIVEAEEMEAGKSGEKAKIDQLVMSQGIISFTKQDTSESLDRTISLTLYSRMLFATLLLPLLHNSTLPTGGSVTSVFNPNLENTSFYPHDLALRDPKNFGFRSASSHMALGTAFFFEGLANEERDENTKEEGKGKGKGVRFAHLYPGFVETNSIENGTVPGWFRWAWNWIIGPVFGLFVGKMPEGECGERLIYLASGRFAARGGVGAVEGKSGGEMGGGEDAAVAADGTRSGGFYRVGAKGEILESTKAYKKFKGDGAGKKVWEHIRRVFEDVERDGVYTGK
ncbi:hypothetical protein MMC10_001318 [Thelotrema lepadinum]|nr:hypothetical protein [Thelotrema lepadinum]